MDNLMLIILVSIYFFFVLIFTEDFIANYEMYKEKYFHQTLARYIWYAPLWMFSIGLTLILLLVDEQEI